MTSASFYGGPSELSATGEGATTRTDRYFILMFHDQRMQAPHLTGPQMDNARWLKRLDRGRVAAERPGGRVRVPGAAQGLPGLHARPRRHPGGG